MIATRVRYLRQKSKRVENATCFVFGSNRIYRQKRVSSRPERRCPPPPRVHVSNYKSNYFVIARHYALSPYYEPVRIPVGRKRRETQWLAARSSGCATVSAYREIGISPRRRTLARIGMSRTRRLWRPNAVIPCYRRLRSDQRWRERYCVEALKYNEYIITTHTRVLAIRVTVFGRWKEKKNGILSPESLVTKIIEDS